MWKLLSNRRKILENLYKNSKVIVKKLNRKKSNFGIDRYLCFCEISRCSI